MKLVITDLDNTLYDWVTYFANAFQAMVDELIPLLSIDRETLLADFKSVHQTYQNSEQPFAVLELPSVRNAFPNADRGELKSLLDPALKAFNLARKQHLQLYPGVERSLKALKEHGVTIVGHTEAIAVNAFYRLDMLGILRYFDHLYALEGKLLPHPVPEREASYQFPEGFLIPLPREERKPNPRLLLDICGKQGVDPSEALYIGDSLTRDMSMAKQAGLLAVWAKYGTRYDSDLWQLLVQITHWSAEDVAREAQLKQKFAEIKPDIIIESFVEIKDLVAAGAMALPN